MWKFQDFSISQILREIKFWDSRSAKTTLLPLYVNFVNYQPSKSAKILGIQNLEPLNVLKWQILHFKNPQN